MLVTKGGEGVELGLPGASMMDLLGGCCTPTLWNRNGFEIMAALIFEIKFCKNNHNKK